MACAKRKLIPQKLTFADALEDTLQLNKTEAKGKVSSTTKMDQISAPGKVILKPTPFIFDPADWEDSPPLGKTKSKSKVNSVKKMDQISAPGKVILKATPFIFDPADWEDSPPLAKSKKGTTKMDGSKKKPVRNEKKENFKYFPPPTSVKAKPLRKTRKELFSGNKNQTNRSPLQEIPITQTKLIIKPSQRVLSSSSVTKQKNTIKTFKKECPEVSNIKINKNSTTLSTDLSFDSSAEQEFLKNEELCRSVKRKNNKNLKLSYTELQDSFNNLQLKYAHLQESFNDLQLKYTNLQQEFNGVHEQMELFQTDMKNYEKSSVQENENFTMDKEGDIPECMSPIKRNLKYEDKIIDADVVEKTVNSYNSLRRGFQNFLITPKINRACLQTPKTLKNNQKDAVSRKVLRQCFLLQDTPAKK